MDYADRLTPLGLMVLALLREGDMHPYEMIRLMRQRHDDRLVAITNGTLYHTVGRLLKLGLLAELGVDRDGNRPERTTYTLTDSGRAAVPAWVRRELPRVDRPEQFRIALSEAHNLQPDEVVDLLVARRETLDAQHRVLCDGLAKAAVREVPEVYLIEVRREAVLLEADLHWLADVIVQLEHQRINWDAGAPDLTNDRYLAQRKAALQ
jgi:DNA-binding PadR family transcriptional regulator